MIKNIYIFRHGETDWNKEKRLQGHKDIPLNENGMAQANEVAEKLLDKQIDLVLSSDLRRARETGEVVAKRLGVRIESATALKEVQLGEMEGMPFSELDRLLGEGTFKRWLGVDPNDDDMRFPGGESKREVQKRAMDFLNRFMESYQGKNFCIATHGFLLIRLLVAIDQNLSSGYIIPNGSVFHFVYDDAQNFRFAGKI